MGLKHRDMIRIEDCLKQRRPMLVLDQIIEYDEKKIIVAEKIDDRRYALFLDGENKVGEVLTLEMLGQAAECLYRLAKGNRKDRGYLVFLHGVKFRRRVSINETVIIEAELTREFGKYVSAEGRSYVDGELIVSARFTHYYS